MPMYDFFCPQCGYECEAIVKSFNSLPPVCQHGEKDSLDNNAACYMEKKLSTGTSFILRGSGWYRDGYSGKK